MPPSTVPTERTLRPWLIVLLPLTAFGLLPWWACTALALALALGRLNDDARSIAALLILLAAVVVALPLLPELLPSGTLFVQTAAVGLLSLLSLRWLESGQRRGLLIPAAVLLFAPTSLGLAALLLVALGLNGAESRPTQQLGGRRELWPLLALALGLGAALLLLPSLPTPSPAPAVSRSAPAPVQPVPTPPPPVLPETRAGTSVRPAPPRLEFRDDPWLARALWPVTALLIVACMVLLLLRARVQAAERRTTWTDYAAILALLGTLFMVLVVGAGAGPGGSAAGAASGQGGPGGAGGRAVLHTAASPEVLLLNIGSVAATLIFAVMAAGLLWSLRSQLAGTKQPAPDTSEPLQGGLSLPALHRIRAAWRDLEAALAQAGLGRRASQTPEEYAAALAAQFPGAAPDLHTLTRLYLPVRYGGVPSDQDADTAEAAAHHIREHVLREHAALPPGSRAHNSPDQEPA
ncbi:DUF4129 domain-containing protein [Deinococcus ruber]|uniref:Protein-glutamine gamma-glutamyltransferase-like C-terminal domain-containing protein n=1 Tax=Deinococcus ruber TaxID=1848197 RepID=A0A918C8L9_9DEIO|nr:DUF4129 domain-containing protein [Deinococcus ruber]GGR12368.1 hypothetical protein GCM10008957_26560 [Deinococcus ruber]